jgi:pyruvate,water dikinase
MAVLVQRLIPADVSIVAFSTNPVGSDDEVLITSTWGLGETLVSGSVIPDSYVVSKGDERRIESTIAIKQRMTLLSQGGSFSACEVDTPNHLANAATLPLGAVGEVYKLVTALEERQGYPVDVEACYENGRLYLLQCRPITA